MMFSVFMKRKRFITAFLLSTFLILVIGQYFKDSIVPVINSEITDSIIHKRIISREGNFKFSREDLRLFLMPLPKRDLSNLTYDNAKDFPCTQSKDVLTSVKVADDVMCYPRPNYNKTFLNPCFVESYSYKQTNIQLTCLPYFHILGFDKCGTTDFHHRLTLHPQIIPNSGTMGKETYFWCCTRFGKPGILHRNTWPKLKLRYYKKMFDKMSLQIVKLWTRANVQLITGDATPMDVWEFRGWIEDPQNTGLQEPRFLTPHAMRHSYENPKFFILLRNPVERLYSDYIFLGYGLTPEKFAVDVPIAIAMMTECLRTHSMRQCFFSEEMYRSLPMRLHISCYSVFLREWFLVFDRQHFLIFRTEDYHSKTTEYMKKAFHFLNISELPEGELDKIAQVKIRHETGRKKTINPMFPETRALLEEFYVTFNEDLASLLGDKRFLWQESA